MKWIMRLNLGDNDRLSAIVAKIVGADLLIMLSDIDGLFDKNPNVYEDATLRSYVPEITEEILASAGGAGSKFGTGGMMSKIKSAQMVFENHSQDSRFKGPLDITPTLSSNLGTGGNNQPFVVENIANYDVRFTSLNTKNSRYKVYETSTSRTLDTGGNNPNANQGGVAIVSIIFN